MGLNILTDAASEPISLAEAKDHIRLEIADDDTIVAANITAATLYVEGEIERQLVTATWKLTLDGFPTDDSAISLNMPPIQSITSIKYLDTVDGTQQTWDSSLYSLDTTSSPGRVYPSFGETYPATRAIQNSVEIEFIAGYGIGSAVPENLKSAVKLMFAHYYENRDAVLFGSMSELPMAVNALLRKFKWRVEA